MTANVLLHGLRLPVALQTAAWLARPWEFMTRCADEFGNTFMIKLAGEGPMVMASYPDAVRDVLTAPPELVHAGEGTTACCCRWWARTRSCCSTMTHTASSARVRVRAR